ncbi:MAG: hypothetical protein ABIR37_00840 [Candidatus Saccharimonadales bacterium]
MADKDVGSKVVVSGSKDQAPVFAIKKIATVVGVIIIVICLLYALPFTRPVVNRYLGIASPQTTGPCSGNTKLLDSYSSTVKQKGANQIDAIAKEVRSKASYASDPSCVYISMVGYYGAGMSQDALKEYEQLMNLKTHGKSPASRIVDGINLKQLHDTLKADTKKPENPYGQG